MTWHELKFLNFYNNIVSQEHVYIIDHGEASNPRSVETNVACFFLWFGLYLSTSVVRNQQGTRNWCNLASYPFF